MAKLSLTTKKLYWQIRQDTASLHYRGSLIFNIMGNGEKWEVLKQSSPQLFDRILSNDLLDSMVLDLMRLLDPARTGRRSNATLEKLIEKVEPIQPVLAKQLKRHRKKMISQLRSMRRWRNKWAAHRDYNTMLIMRTPSRAKLRVRFNRDKVNAALKELVAFLNAFEDAFQDRNFTPKNRDEAENIVPEVTDYSTFDATNEIESLLKLLKSKQGT